MEQPGRPGLDDVVVRQKSGKSSRYVLGTFAAPEQILYHSRSAAVQDALGFAASRQVKAWFLDDGYGFVALEPRVTPSAS